MKGPARPAPAVPGFGVNRYSPVTNWNDDPFGSDLFEPAPQFAQKKKPPPRPPPPKVNKLPDIPAKPSHFIRKPTVLSSLLSRKNKSTTSTQQTLSTELSTEILNDANRMFPKCEPKNVHTGALIDLSSPPSSPTFTTRSSSDGLSVDSFGSDATTSTNHQNAFNGGSISQAESGFEDDFDLFLNSRKINKEDTFDDFSTIDPFSPQPVSSKPVLPKKPVFNKDMFDGTCNFKSSTTVGPFKGPTIIRAKPARPKPPDNSALLKSTFGNSLLMTSMNINTTTPIQKVSSAFGDSFEDSKTFSWDVEGSPEREPSPPMPSIPPPPPPVIDEADLAVWPDDDLEPAFQLEQATTSGFHFEPASCQLNQVESTFRSSGDDEPYAIALFDYHTGHPDDLSFTINTRINLIRRVDDEWLFGSARNGAQGLFPSNYVEIKVPLPNEPTPTTPTLATALALYDFEPAMEGDLRFRAGDTLNVHQKLNEEWYFGECCGAKGQFPANYVQMNS